MKKPKPFKQFCVGVTALTLAVSAANVHAQTFITESYTNKFDTDGSTEPFAGSGSVKSWITWYNTPGGNLPMTNDVTMDAGNDPSSGSLRVVSPFTNSTQNVFFGTFGNGGGYDFSVRADLTKYTNITFDIRVDTNMVPNGAGNFGNLGVGIITAGYGYQQSGTVTIPANATNGWVHCSVKIDQTQNNLLNVPGIAFGYNSYSGYPLTTMIFWIDNLTVELNPGPPPPPPTMGLAKAGPVGVKITMDNNTDQWQRNAISTGTNGNPYLWTSQGSYPVTYSCTITNFPDAVSHPGFEAHMYLVNGDTGGGNQVNGAADWNSPDLFIFRVENGGAGGAYAQIQWKTNYPNSNATNVPVIVTGPAVNGTWSVTFTDSTSGTLTGPGITATNFTLPADAVLNNFSPGASFVQFGMFKNDGANDGHNNQAHGTFSRVQFTGAAAPFDDNFNGATLTNNFPWRKTSASAVQQVPPGTTWWLNWTLPALGFLPQSAPTIMGPWADTGTSTYQSAGMSFASVDTTGDAAYFRLIKRSFTQLQVLLPGETAAPNTPTGKTGTPTPITISSGLSMDVTVRAVDPDWNLVAVTDTIRLSTDEPNAILPAGDVAMVNGVATFTGNNSILFTAEGSWTVTATNVSRVMPAANSSPVTVTP